MKLKRTKKEDFGRAEFYCAKCDHRVEIDWETIWSIQECTIGYVGHHLNDTFISCDKCGEICVDEENVEVKQFDSTKVSKEIGDDELPF